MHESHVAPNIYRVILSARLWSGHGGRYGPGDGIDQTKERSFYYDCFKSPQRMGILIFIRHRSFSRKLKRLQTERCQACGSLALLLERNYLISSQLDPLPSNRGLIASRMIFLLLVKAMVESVAAYNPPRLQHRHANSSQMRADEVQTTFVPIPGTFF